MELTKPTLDLFLRKHTLTVHQRTEQALEPLQLFNQLTLSNYGTFIRIQFLWHDAMEALLRGAKPSLIFDGYAYKPKAALLKKDLKSLGLSDEPLNFRSWKNPALPGILYVLEGSMLGGTIIAKHLEAQGIPPDCRNYFSYCAENAKSIWPLTRKYLQTIQDTGYFFDCCLKTSISSFEKMIEITESEIKSTSLMEGLNSERC